MNKIAYLILAVILFSCVTKQEKEIASIPEGEKHTFLIEELTDEDYPDNPDIGFRSSEYNSDFFKKGEVIAQKNHEFDLIFYSKDKYQDTILFHNLDLDEFIPTVPDYLKQEEYLKYISLINQEWNRNQVRFASSQFFSTNKNISRVDIARNCLNSFLWEVIVFKKEEGKDLPIHHGWFHFPEEVYKHLFKRKNEVPFDAYSDPLEHWVDPEKKEVKLSLLRKVIKEYKISFEDLSDEPYPIAGARKKKFKEIIYPKSFMSMKDLQTDKTTFAAYSSPGFYNKKDPRKTELGRFFFLEEVKVLEVKSKASDEKLHEVCLKFHDKENNRITQLVVGGLNFNVFPNLGPDYANSGWKSSMGIGNHSFYETYEEHEHLKCDHNPYYSLLLNEKDQFLDSHLIGIDGPIFHFDREDPYVLHLWLLSFERHALVGHYKIDLKVKK